MTIFTNLIGVPVDCSGSFAGCERMPAALRAAGIASALGARDDGNLQVAIADPTRDRATGIVGFHDVVGMTSVVRSAVAPVLAAGERPLLIGGCCSLLVGACAAARDVVSSPGLVFVDGHLDFYDGATSQSGEFADMELAVIAGFGPEPLVSHPDIGTALISHNRIAVLGPWDEHDAAGNGAPDPRKRAPEILIRTSEEVAADAPATARTALARMHENASTYWLHLDFDVLSARTLRSVDYPDERGLNWETLALLVRPLLHDPALVGASITIYNPTYDPSGDDARRIVTALSDFVRE